MILTQFPCHKLSHRDRNRKLQISRAPTKAKSQEPAYSQSLNQNKSIGSGQDPESPADSQTAMVDGAWS